MELPEFDGRRADELMAELLRLAAWYTPEWRPDEADPDAGLALARLFAELMEGTLRCGGARLQNHFLAFLNLTGGGRRAPISAGGLARISAQPGGGMVPAGTVLYAPADNAEGRVYFETAEELYAVDNEIESLFLTDRETDQIQRLFSRREGEDWPEIRLFDLNQGENLQKHTLYLAEDVVFYAETRSELVLTFENQNSRQNREKLPEQLLKNVQWQYFDGEAWKTIPETERYGGGIRLRFPGGARPREVRGKTARFLRARFASAPDEPILLDGITCAAQGANLAPDALVWGSESLPQTDLLPFGEMPTQFDYFYLGSREAFGKKGALAELTFELSFRRVRPDGLPEPPAVQYKNVMKKDALEPPAPAELKVERVVWEYWNGLGWKRLQTEGDCEGLFAPGGGGTVRSMAFFCPEDLAPSEQGAERSLFLRARPVQVGRPAALGDCYLVPVIRRVSVGYRYSKGGRPCACLLEQSDLQWKEHTLPAPQPVPLLARTLCPHPALYLRLKEPLLNGPVSLLLELREQVGAMRPRLRWEYYGADRRGRGSWRSIEARDGTEDLAHSGVAVLEGREDFLRGTLFGETGYFLRLVDEDSGYRLEKKLPPPRLAGLSFNAAPVIQRDARRPERFSIAAQEAGKLCRLSAGSFCRAEVWVDELGVLSRKEQDALLLREGGGVEAERDGAGRLRRLWVRWREVERLSLQGGGERAYEADPCEGCVRFGDGVHGAIPPPGETIRISYSVSAGGLGNLAAGRLAGFTKSVPGAAGVRNPRALLGGSGPESLESAALRLNALRNCGGRAVTGADLEELLLRADPNLCAVRCAPHTNRLGESAPGVLSVAVLPRGFRGDRDAFAAIEARARALLAPRLPASLTELSFFEADYLEISVTAELSVPYERRAGTRERARAVLRRYLDPERWQIGQLPNVDEVRRLLLSLDGVEAAPRLALFPRAVMEDGPREVDWRRLPRRIFSAPVCGELCVNVR